jgi:hypothetical protein
MPHSGELSRQRSASRKEQLRLLSAVSRNQAALASDQNERQRFLLTRESDNNRRRDRRAEGGQDAGLAVQMRVHLREDPEGGVPRHALGAWRAAHSAAQPPHRGGWVGGTPCVGGWWSAAAEACVRGGDVRRHLVRGGDVLLVTIHHCCRRRWGFVPVARAFSLTGRSSSPAELGGVGKQLCRRRCDAYGVVPMSLMGLSTEQAFA